MFSVYMASLCCILDLCILRLAHKKTGTHKTLMISEENLVCNEMQQRNRIVDCFKDSTASKPHQQTCVQLRRKGGKLWWMSENS